MTSSIYQLEYRGKQLTYTLYRKDVKNINLRINKKLEIIVSANKRVSIERINDFIFQKWDWIEKAKKNIEKRNAIQDFPEEIDAVRFLGKIYPLVVSKGSSNLTILDDQIILSSNKKTLESVLKELRKLLEKEFIRVVDLMKPKYDSIISHYGIALPTFKYRYMKGKWGSCEVKKRVITLSYNLMFYPIESIEYVLWHEYAHLIVPNHSKRFHQLVEYHMPNYKFYQSFLK